MKLTRAQKKAKLQAAAEALIEELLAWDEQNQAPNMTQIEDEVLKLRQQFGQEMAGVVLEGQVAREPAENPLCLQCGKPLRYKGRKGKQVESRLGGMKVKRGAYYCQDCASSFFPPRPPT
jgi:hypothetical protein